MEATEHGQPLSIGAVYNGNEFYELIRPKTIKDITPRITDLTGITQKDVINCEKFKVIFGRFLEWAPVKTPVYVFGGFDKFILKRGDSEMTKKFCKRVVNIQPAMSKFFRPKSQVISLKDLLKELGINTEQNHNSLDDAKILREVYICIKQKSEEELTKLLKKANPTLDPSKIIATLKSI